MTAKPYLRDVIKEAIEEQEQSLRRVAVLAGVKLSNLKSWLQRNTYPYSQAKEVLRVLRLPEERHELERDYICSWSRERAQRDSIAKADNLVLALDRMGNLLQSHVRNYPDFVEAVARLFESMGDEDIFAYFSADLIPFEMTNKGWLQLREPLTKAVEAGAHLIYIRPSDDAIADLRGSGIRGLIDGRTFTQEHDNLVARITQSSKNLSRTDVQSRVRMVPIQHYPFLGIQQKHTIYWPAKEAKAIRAFGSYKARQGREAFDLHVDLSEDCTTMMLTYLCEVLQNHVELLAHRVAEVGILAE